MAPCTIQEQSPVSLTVDGQITYFYLPFTICLNQFKHSKKYYRLYVQKKQSICKDSFPVLHFSHILKMTAFLIFCDENTSQFIINPCNSHNHSQFMDLFK